MMHRNNKFEDVVREVQSKFIKSGCSSIEARFLSQKATLPIKNKIREFGIGEDLNLLNQENFPLDETLKKRFKYVLVFITQLFLMMLYLFKNGKNQARISDIVFVYGIPYKLHKSSHEVRNLKEFLLETRFSIRTRKPIFVVQQISVPFQFESDFFVTPDIAIWIFRNCLSRKSKLRVLNVVCKNLIKRNSNVIPFYFSKWLLLDLHILEHFETLHEEDKKNEIFISQSYMDSFPLICFFEKYRKKMLWYSANSYPFQSSKKKIIYDNSLFKFDLIDENFVWTKDNADFLKKAGNQSVSSVGSIMFIPNEKLKIEKSRNFVVSVFDVTPFYGLKTPHYYNESRCIKFITDIYKAIEMISGSNITLVIKQKRNISSFLFKIKLFKSGLSVSPRYRDLIKYLGKKSNVQIEFETRQIYQTIAKSNLVIAIPLTSPFYIARELGVNAIYYEAISDDIWNYREFIGLPASIVDNFESLSKVVEFHYNIWRNLVTTSK